MIKTPERCRTWEAGGRRSSSHGATAPQVSRLWARPRLRERMVSAARLGLMLLTNACRVAPSQVDHERGIAPDLCDAQVTRSGRGSMSTSLQDLTLHASKRDRIALRICFICCSGQRCIGDSEGRVLNGTR